VRCAALASNATQKLLVKAAGNAMFHLSLSRKKLRQFGRFRRLDLQSGGVESKLLPPGILPPPSFVPKITHTVKATVFASFLALLAFS
jgi:hypothetical protein